MKPFKFALGDTVETFDGVIKGLLVIGQTQFIDGTHGYFLSKSGFRGGDVVMMRHSVSEYELRASKE